MSLASRAVICAASAAAGLVWGSAAPAAQPVPNWKTIYFLSGTCERLITPGEDRTPSCVSTAVHMVYRDGRSSYAFSDGEAAMVSFSGVAEAFDEQRGSLALDHISVASNPGPQVQSEAASGTCEFSNPYRGQSYIRCSGRTASGDFSASFTSDGKPPEKQDF